MSETSENMTLENMVGPTQFVILPGLTLEDKMTVKTQRKLERHFQIPISLIFPGEVTVGGKTEKWEGIDFRFIDNMIPLVTIMAQQVNPGITEEYVESLMDDEETAELLDNKLEEFFAMLRKTGQAKNSQKPKKTKTVTTTKK